MTICGQQSLIMIMTIFMPREGFKKMRQKCGLLPNLPRTPILWKKIDPHYFLLENASVIAETNFTFGPMFKTNLFPL